MARPQCTEAESKDMIKKEDNEESSTEADSTVSEDVTSTISEKEEEGGEDGVELVCHLLKMLPLEIRKMIYRILFLRPVAIVPGPVRYKCSIGWRHKPVVPIYSYQWDHLRQNGHEEFGLPKYDGSYCGLQIAWRSKPTLVQERMTTADNFLTSTLNSEERLPTTTYNEDLRAEQLLEECRAVLYGENTFNFDTRGQFPYTHHRGIHAHDTFDKAPHQIPGLPREDGTVTQCNIDRAIGHMFDKDVRQQKEDRKSKGLRGVEASRPGRGPAKKQGAVSSRPDAFASLVDRALADVGLNDDGEAVKENGKPAARPSFRQTQKAKSGAKELAKEGD
ncbi:hypothetical protein IFR05_008037 [Cadophora sp. M221]|nr:hypothetical protein IFR05_008037 [Cadophora sp. M221]